MTDDPPKSPEDADGPLPTGRAKIRLAYDGANLVSSGDDDQPKAGSSSKKKSRAPAAPIKRDTWVDNLQRDSKQSPLPNLSNALIALRMAPNVTDLFSYDEMRCQIILKGQIPCVNSRSAVQQSLWRDRNIEDFHASQLQEWLQTEIPMIGINIVHQAIEARARECAFHPVLQYLDSLTWDRKPRLNQWLTYYAGAEPSEYHSEIGRMFFIAMVARIFQPGCQVDYVVIFEGLQGIRKSTFWRILAGGEEYFSDDIPDITSKDARHHMRGKWLIELAELASVRRTEIAALKAFLTRRTDRYRPAFGRNEISQPRQCVFAGTVNVKHYLRDSSGNRRFWPVLTKSIDLDAFLLDRDQLFAESVYLYKNNSQWWPDSEFEKLHIVPEQEARMEESTWEENILRYLEGKLSVFISDVAVLGIGMQLKEFRTAERDIITAVLEKAGWSRADKRATGGRTPWVKGDESEAVSE